MTSEVLSSPGEDVAVPRRAVLAYLAVAGTVLLLMMLFGLAMRLTQAGWLPVQPDLFYEIMTMHGAGMVGTAAIGGAAVMWYFVRRHVPVSTAVFLLNLVLFIVGAVLILGAGFIGGFAAGWTFLFPLPAHSGSVWSANAAAAYFLGLMMIGVGFLLLHLDIARGVIAVYGSLANGLGVKQAFGLAPESSGPPAAVVASTMVLIVNILGIVLGAAILVICLVNLYVPSFTIDPLVAKNLTYFFGHVFINATIYMAVIAVYEILPLYTGHKWKLNRLFYLGWVVSTLMVLAVFPHHLLMDFAMPTWALVLGQVVSYLSGLPVLLITAFGALTNVYRSGIRWDAASGLLFVGIMGWSIGVVPAIADGTIEVNSVMHNTQWVPGHFHTYLLLGMMAMMLGFMCFLARGRRAAPPRGPVLGFWLFVVGALVFVLAFLAAGSASVPRRYAVHLPQWLPYDRLGSVGAALAVVGAVILVGGFLLRLRAAAQDVVDVPR